MNDTHQESQGAAREVFARMLAEAHDEALADPFANPTLLFALRLDAALEQGGTSAEDVGEAVRTLTAEAFLARAERLRHYLGNPDPEKDRAALVAFFEHLAGSGDFRAFAAQVQRMPFGVVFTGHPTFSLNHALAHALVALATARSADGTPLDDHARARLMEDVRTHRHGPPADLTLEVEHRWSVEALSAAHDALEDAYRAAFQVARRHWPERWTDLRPRLISFASWVGYDQDGRTDITWIKTVEKRLAVKRAALARHQATLKSLPDGNESWRAAIETLRAMFDTAAATVAEQERLLAAARTDAAAVPAFARAVVAGREPGLADPARLTAPLEAARAAAPDDGACETLLTLRASLATHGLTLAHTHVRLNSVQLHNAVRREVGLTTDPTDPANKRTYFGAINDLIASAEPVRVSFASLMAERASAKRLMMTIAEIVKHIDAVSPVRFLIAETETGFTLLTALHYAKLFGVADHIEISPLFETAEAFDRGEKVIEEALKSPHFVDYLKRQGRIAVQFGFSDSGRFIGQMAATFRIERLRLRLAQLLERYQLTELEIVLFNTHGESIGRGGHPATMKDRLAYAAPPVSRWEFARRRIRAREEDSFQGGDGFLPFLTPTVARASLKDILTFAYSGYLDADSDPIYADPDYASEFFAGVQQQFARLADDPDYAALIDLFGTRLLERTGSRPNLRQLENWAQPPAMQHVSELRAIPNNGILQQLGFLANTLFGVGRAAAKDCDTFHAMLADSPRFRRALDMVAAARLLGDPHIARAYAATVDPGMWLARAGGGEAASEASRLRALRTVAERAALHDRLARVLRAMEDDAQRLAETWPPAAALDARRTRVHLLHALRVALIGRICMLAMRIPDFSPQHGLTLMQIRDRLLRLDLGPAIEALRDIFPKTADAPPAADFGEADDYHPSATLSYAFEEETLFAPLERLHDLLLAISDALTHECGACG